MSGLVLAGLLGKAALCDPVNKLVGRDAVAVRALIFRKSAGVNWRVAWHQDQTVALVRRVESSPGFGKWTTKDGVPHAVAPTGLLSRMVTARIHLDDVTANDGPLEVLEGTHKDGRCSVRELGALVEERRIEICLAAAGEIHLLRPLLAHRSRRTRGHGLRRVIHIEFAPRDALPSPLSWHTEIPLG